MDNPLPNINLENNRRDFLMIRPTPLLNTWVTAITLWQMTMSDYYYHYYYYYYLKFQGRILVTLNATASSRNYYASVVSVWAPHWYELAKLVYMTPACEPGPKTYMQRNGTHGCIRKYKDAQCCVVFISQTLFQASWLDQFVHQLPIAVNIAGCKMQLTKPYTIIYLKHEPVIALT